MQHRLEAGYRIWDSTRTLHLSGYRNPSKILNLDITLRNRRQINQAACPSGTIRSARLSLYLPSAILQQKSVDVLDDPETAPGLLEKLTDL
jgi:hypothetical protein